MATRADVDDQALLASISHASSTNPCLLTPPAMLSREDFLQLVRNAPLVSIDLIVRDAQGRVLLGLRNNRPAQGWWFVPGGIVRKGERLEQAFRRISEAELGSVHELSAARSLGHYEHLYDDNFAGEPGFGTHYVVLAWELDAAARCDRPSPASNTVTIGG